MSDFRVLVCGGRAFTDWGVVFGALNALNAGRPISLVIHGAAPGADLLGQRWAVLAGVPHRPFPADWRAHGKKAGPLRNQQMLDEGKPDVVLAFPGGVGTADMVQRAERAGVRVIPIAAAP